MDLRNSTFQSLNQPVRDEEEEKKNINPFTQEDLDFFKQAGILEETPIQTIETEQPQPAPIEQPEIIQPKPIEPTTQETTSPFNAEDLEVFRQAGILEQPQQPTPTAITPTPITPTEEEGTGEGFFRQAADLPVKFGIAVNDSVKALTDLFGADNAVSQNLKQNSEWYRSLLSAQALRDEEEISRILSEADDKGILDQIGAGLQAFAVAPLDMTASGLGSLATFVATGVAGRAAAVARAGKLGLAGAEATKYVDKFVRATQGLTGAGMGIGIVKGEIYDSVKQEMLDQGKTEEESKKIAMEAQAYNGKNLDQILIAGGLGAVDALTGANKVINKVLTKNGLEAGASRIKNIITNGITEAAPEAVQAAQEKFASNLALQREGVDVDLTKGLVSQATLEGVVGGVLGTVAGGVEPRVEAKNNASTKVNEIENEAIKEEELKSKAAEITELDPTKTATERLQTRSKELEAKKIPNEALKVVEEQIKQTKGAPAAVDKSAADILVEKAEELDKADIKAIELDDESKVQLTNVAQNKAKPIEVKTLKDKGYIYEVEGELIIPEPIKLGMGKEAPQLSEKARLEQVRDRFKITNEELNNSTDDDLISALDRGRKAVPKLNQRNAARATQSLDTIKTELRRRSGIEAETGAGKRKTIDNRYLATLDTQEEKDSYIETQLTEATQNNNVVDIVIPKTKKVNKVIGYDRPTGDFITTNETTGKEERIPANLVATGKSRLEIFDPKTSRSRKPVEIAETTTQRIVSLPVPKEGIIADIDEVQSTPLEGFEPSEGTKIVAGKKAAALRKANASKPLEFLTNMSKQEGLKSKVADLLLKSGIGDAKVTIGRFGKAKDPNNRFAGKYNRTTNEITINLDERDSYLNEDGTHDVESTLLHELSHAAFANKLANKDTLDPAEAKAVREMEAIYERFKEAYSKTKGDYSNNTQNAFNNLQEFASEILVNPEIQTLVEDLSPDKSVLQKILQYILNFIQGKELNPYNEVSRAWKALNTLTTKPVVKEEAEVTPIAEAEITPAQEVVAEVTQPTEAETITAEGELLSPATDFVKKQFGVKTGTSYTKELPMVGTRWFFNGKLIKPVQRLLENLKGKKDKLEFKLATIQNKLIRAAKADGVDYNEWSETAYVAFMRSPEGTTVEQNEQARIAAQDAAVEPFNKYLERKLSKEQYDALQRIFGSEKITVDKALRQVVDLKTYNQLQSYKDTLIKRERVKADLKNVNDNIAKATKEAQIALDKLPPNMKKLILEIRNEVEQATGGAIKNGVISPNAKVILSKLEGEGIGFILPDDLKKSSPKYGKAKIKFDSDLDLAAYVLANDEKKASKSAFKFRKSIEEAGYDLDDVIEHGKKVKEAIKEESGVKGAPKTEMEIQLPIQQYTGKVKPAIETKATKAQPRDKKVKLQLEELFWANIDKDFIDKLKLDTDTIDGLLQFIQDAYISNIADQIVRGESTPTLEELQDVGLKTGRRLSKAKAKQIASNRITEQEAKNILENFLEQAKNSPMDGFKKLSEELQMTDEQKLAGLPKVFKEALKPLNDAGLAYIQMMYNVSQDIIYRDIFNQMRELGLSMGWAYDPNEWNVKESGPEPSGYVEIKSRIPGFGPIFAGLKVDPTFVEGIEERFAKSGDMGPINKVLNTGNIAGQLAVTAYDVPRGIFRQLLGGVLFILHSGSLNSDYKSAMKSVVTAFRRDSKNPEQLKYIERLIELNLVDEDVNMNRLRDAARGLIDQDINSFADISSFLKPQKYKDYANVLTRMYQVPDSFWRVSVFEAEKKIVKKAFPNMGEREVEALAAERTKEAMPTYARMNDLGMKLRKPGIQNFIGAFIGFGMEVMRVMYSSGNLAYQDIKSTNPVLKTQGFKRMAGMMSAYASVALVGKIAAAMAGIGDDEEEAARRTMGFNQFDEVIWFRNKDGGLGYFSLSWLSPFAMYTSNPLRAMIDSYARNDDSLINETLYAITNGVKESFGSYLSLNIFSQRTADVIFNPEQKIWNPEASPGKITSDMVGHLIGGVQPANIERLKELGNAMSGTPLSSGDVPSKSSTALNLALGKARDVRPQQFLRSKAFEMDKRLRNAAQLFTKPVKTRGLISDSEIETAYNEANKANYAILYEAAIYFNDQLKLGVPEQDVLNILKDARFSNKEIAQIREGIIRPYEASDSTLTAMGLIDPKRVQVYNNIYKKKADEFILFRDIELELRKLEQ